MRQDNYKFFKNFQGRSDLTKYGDNALLLYSLQIKYGIDDIDEVASTSLVDGFDDKKTDLIYIDTERNEAVIAQGYYSKKDKTEAPANKASDLNTAVSWLLTRDIDDLPERLQSAATELRTRIQEGEIKRITLWYSHNLPESDNVKQELRSAEQTLASILNTHFLGCNAEAATIEVGIDTLEDWYTGLTIPILVSDTIIINDAVGFEVIETGWSCFNCMIPAHVIYGLYKAHGSKLFSANVRDYLGSRKSDSNINNGIKTTAEDEPNNFYVYNNGITALVNDYSFGHSVLTINGLSIVNGAQTTGALSSLKTAPNQQIKLPARLIKCGNSETIGRIVKFNNSQNKINAPDFRSSDRVQTRLLKEFNDLDVIDYSSRRGGATDVIKRNPDLLPSVTVGQILAAFHGEPGTAYNEKSKIWESDKLYAAYFNEQTSAKHIIFIYTLLKAIENYKLELINSDELTEDQENALSLLRTRGAMVLLLTAIAECMEIFLGGRKISKRFNLCFNKNVSIKDGMALWRPILEIALSFSDHLKTGLKDGIKNQDKIKETLTGYKQYVSAVKVPNKETINKFSNEVGL